MRVLQPLDVEQVLDVPVLHIDEDDSFLSEFLEFVALQVTPEVQVSSSAAVVVQEQEILKLVFLANVYNIALLSKLPTHVSLLRFLELWNRWWMFRYLVVLPRLLLREMLNAWWMFPYTVVFPRLFLRVLLSR